MLKMSQYPLRVYIYPSKLNNSSVYPYNILQEELTFYSEQAEKDNSFGKRSH